MNIKKFLGTTTREALRMVREALGADAVILSNRNINGSVEIMALSGDDMTNFSSPIVSDLKVLASQEKVADASNIKLPTRTVGGSHHISPAFPESSSPLTFASQLQGPRDQADGLSGAISAAHDKAQQSHTAAKSGSPLLQSELASVSEGLSGSLEFAAVMAEIRSMRSMFESQLSELTWSSKAMREPSRSNVLRDMLASGFSAGLSRFLIDKIPAGLNAEESLKWVKSILARNLTTLDNDQEMIERGGVFALVGPTGVGKTTTTAKLAARCVMKHGPGKLALITTDGYRIGGYEQLRIYGKILGVMVHSVKDQSDLKIALDELRGKHTILIDTVGVSQRDKMVAEQVSMLNGAGTKVHRLLCLSATSTGETLSEVVRAYRGDGLTGCIMTKLDESATIGGVLDVVVRQKLNLYYMANGQRVPEDIHVANQQFLVDRAFKLIRTTAPFHLNDTELPIALSAGIRNSQGDNFREMRFV